MAINAFTYHTVSQRGEAEWKDRGSRFIGIAVPVESTQAIKQALEQIREQYPRATHYCYAWRVGFTGQQFRANDDGEPSGSAGKPILGQIDSNAITNTLVVVVRYYGGSKLGVPGLINAYKTAASEAIQQAGLLEKPYCIYASITFDYTQMNHVMRCLKPFQVDIKHQEIGLFCSMNIAIPLRDKDIVLNQLNDIRNINITLISEGNS
jgi:uncharacterized YigZ family protein